eukprot:658208_1
MVEQTAIQEAFNTIVGSLCIACGFICFSTNEMIVKWSQLDVAQLLFGRYCVQFIIACFWWNCKKPKGSFVNHWYGDTPFVRNIFFRGIAYNLFMVTLWLAMKLLPIGDANSIVSQNALLTAALGKILFKERLPKLFIPVLLLGVIGSLFISQPTFLQYWFSDIQHIQPLNPYGLILIVIAIISWSVCCILIRSAKEAHFLQLELVSSAQMLFVAVPLILLFNTFLQLKLLGTFNTLQFDSLSIGVSIVTGFIGFAGLSLCVIGYQLGDATKVSWLEYSTIAFSCLYQTFVFQDPLNISESIGIVLVVASCVANLFEQYYNFIQAKKHHQEMIEPTLQEQRVFLDNSDCVQTDSSVS